MASPNPVPSRAALHALRGVILTTSCSVAFLAEERRRRLKVARAAIENARMLHLASSGRAPLVLADAQHETLPSSSFPRPRTSTRRRRRHPQPSQAPSESPADSGGPIATRSMRPAEASATVAPLSNILHDLQSRASRLLNSDTLWRTRPRALQSYRKSDLKSSKLYSTLELTNSLGPAILSTPSNNAKATLTAQGRSAWQLRDESGPSSIDTPQGGGGPDATESAKELLASSSPIKYPEALYDKALALLHRLLQDFALQLSEAEALDKLRIAAAIIQRLATLGPPTATAVEPLACASTSLLQIALHHDRNGATLAIQNLLRLSKSPLEILIPLAEFMNRGGPSGHMERALQFLSEPESRWFWMDGMLIHRILAYWNMSQGSFQDTKQLYQALQDAGLFQKFNVSQATEFNIRALMAFAASDQGDDAFFTAEMVALQKVSSDTMTHGAELQHLLLIREAMQGDRDSVHSRVENLRRSVGISCDWLQFQGSLTRLTNIYARTRSPRELEMHVRDMVTRYRMKISHAWVHAVFDRHASRRRTDSAFSWLKFCCDNGLAMDESFFQSLYYRCRKYWCFSDRSIEKLRRRLENVSSMAPRLSHHLIVPDTASSSDYEWLKAKQTHSSAARAVKRHSNQSLAKAPSLFGERLRLAVVELLASETSGVEKAASLVEKAHAQGVDISDAMTPILLARLEEGEDPNYVISKALRMGVRIHGSVFNKSSHVLAASGNLPASAYMCRIAAQENGKGDLAYDEYNFSNLVFAYTGSGRYGALRTLLSEFTSEVLWWRGGRVSKESIKLAMKTVAMRAVVYVKEHRRHKNALKKLDEALMHVKRCRTTPEDRHMVADTLVRIFAASSRPRPADQKDMTDQADGYRSVSVTAVEEEDI